MSQARDAMVSESNHVVLTDLIAKMQVLQNEIEQARVFIESSITHLNILFPQTAKVLELNKGAKALYTQIESALKLFKQKSNDPKFLQLILQLDKKLTHLKTSNEELEKVFVSPISDVEKDVVGLKSLKVTSHKQAQVLGDCIDIIENIITTAKSCEELRKDTAKTLDACSKGVKPVAEKITEAMEKAKAKNSSQMFQHANKPTEGNEPPSSEGTKLTS